MKKYTLLLCYILWCLVPARAQHTAKPFILGQIDTLPSEILRETRILNIYLPPDYHPDSAARYPVVYLLDGSADEDFIHVAGLLQFCNFPWVKVMPPAIVVGIANVDRRRDFTFPTTVAEDLKRNPTSGHSEAFIAFLERELIPYIDKHYRTAPARMLIGQSLGGLLAVEVLFKKPQLFNHYLIVSPSLWWDNGSLFKYSPSAFSQPVDVFVAVGKEGKIMENGSRRLVKTLKNMSSGPRNLAFNFLKNRNHATIFHQAVYEGFEVLGKVFTTGKS